MNGNSKSEKVDSFIRRQVERAIHEIAFNKPSYREVLGALKNDLEVTIAWNVSQDVYRFQELKDIMAWKKRPNE